MPIHYKEQLADLADEQAARLKDTAIRIRQEIKPNARKQSSKLTASHAARARGEAKHPRKKTSEGIGIIPIG